MASSRSASPGVRGAAARELRIWPDNDSDVVARLAHPVRIHIDRARAQLALLLWNGPMVRIPSGALSNPVVAGEILANRVKNHERLGIALVVAYDPRWLSGAKADIAGDLGRRSPDRVVQQNDSFIR